MKASFCEAVYQAKTYRYVENRDPQLFVTPKPIFINIDYPQAVECERRVVNGTVYAFPWSHLGLPCDVLFLRFWFDEQSKELRIAYVEQKERRSMN